MDVPRLDTAHRQIIEAARRLNVRVRYYYEDRMVGAHRRCVGELFGVRQPRQMGKLASVAGIVDVPEHFEANLGRTDHPGRLGRRFRGHEPFHERFSVVQDQHWTVIEHHRRAEATNITVRNDQLLGIANVADRAVAFTIDDTFVLPDLSYWSKVDFRGRDFAAWAYDRALIRLGM
jgi:hypothetical protein